MLESQPLLLNTCKYYQALLSTILFKVSCHFSGSVTYIYESLKKRLNTVFKKYWLFRPKIEINFFFDQTPEGVLAYSTGLNFVCIGGEGSFYVHIARKIFFFCFASRISFL